MSRMKTVTDRHEYPYPHPRVGHFSRWLSRIVDSLPYQVQDITKLNIVSSSPVVIETTYARAETQEEKEEREYDEAIAKDIERLRKEAEKYGFKLEPLMV